MQKTDLKAGEMAQWLRHFLCNAGDLSSLPRAHARKERKDSSQLTSDLHMCVHMHRMHPALSPECQGKGGALSELNLGSGKDSVRPCYVIPTHFCELIATAVLCIP